MKVIMYGKKHNQNCQNARRILRANQVEIEFRDLEKKANKKELIDATEVMEKQAGYKFKSLEDNDQPIVVSPKTDEVLVGYETDSPIYDNIVKQAESDKVNHFVKKYPELANNS